MNQQETIELWERCEAARAKARVEALAAGDDDAEGTAHAAAKEVWNAWAEEMLARRKALEEAGEWAAKKDMLGKLKAKNDVTAAWMKSASVDFSSLRFQCEALEHQEPPTSVMARLAPSPQSDEHKQPDTDPPSLKLIGVKGRTIRFDGFIFPSRTNFDNARFDAEVWFHNTLLGDEVRFENAHFDKAVWFAEAIFCGGTEFYCARFEAKAGFDGARFNGEADFHRARFANLAQFVNAKFDSSAGFEDVQFCNRAEFRSVQFGGEVRFASATFSGDAWFEGATFGGTAGFSCARFNCEAMFANAQFHAKAGFTGTQFNRAARFKGAQFHSSVRFDDAEFRGVQFVGAARFEEAQFYDKARFCAVKFGGTARFEGVQYHGRVWFERAQFDRGALFGDAKFGGDTSFFLVQFMQYARFDKATFRKEANFSAIRSERAFTMAEATFDGVPDFIQAHFVEAPRLDNVKVNAAEKTGFIPFICRFIQRRCNSEVQQGLVDGDEHLAGSSVTKNLSDDDAEARFRALRRLAVQGHDHENERQFLKGEIRARRRTVDQPWHAAFWVGLGYELLSDFGGSITRPISWGIASVVAFAAVYFWLAPGDCAASLELAGQALFLSLKNAVLLISWDSVMDGAKASCLKAPEGASIWPTLGFGAVQMLQKLVSAILWFLLLLGVRNRFRIK